MAPSQNSRQAPPTSRERRGLRLLLSRQQDTSCLKLLTFSSSAFAQEERKDEALQTFNLQRRKVWSWSSPLPSLQTQEIPRPGADGHRALHNSQLLRPGHGEVTEELASKQKSLLPHPRHKKTESFLQSNETEESSISKTQPGPSKVSRKTPHRHVMLRY